ncbi:MAG: WbfN protein [candidate division TM6 bacterium GW2011_GWF2_37_49]|nr:MAG: WbfN protein [candidate division TM6 bacterium GW2011_GWF2_37_49]
MKNFFRSLGKLVWIVILCCMHLRAKEVDKASILDAIAIQTCISNKDTYIALLFPCVHGHDEKIKKLFQRYGKIVYKTTVNLTGNGPLNLLKIAYKNFTLYYNLKKRFTIPQADGSYQLTVVVFEAKSLKNVKKCKKKIRKLFKIGHYPIHINDTHEETIELAQTLLISENLHFINTETLLNF